MFSTARSRRHRNVQAHDEQKSAQPFFSKSADTPLQHKQVGGIPQTPFFQRKGIAIGQPNDKYEQEADAVASKVVNKSPEEKPVVQQKEISGIQRLATSKEDEKFSTTDARMAHDKEIQEKPIQKTGEAPKEEEKTTPVQAKGSSSASPQVSSKIANSAGKGNAMSPKTQQEMSSSFGTDFSHVRVHNDSEAVGLNKELQAQAFTHGNDIYFNEGKYDPNSDSGKHLLAHELTHVVQQGGGNEQKVQRKTGDGHDLTSTKLTGDTILENTFDQETIIGKHKNSQGNHVKLLKEALISLKIPLKSGANEEYDNEMTEAVKTFQRKSKMGILEWDGIIGRKTIGLLDRSLRNKSISTDDDKTENDFKVKNKKQAKEDKECEGKPKEIDNNKDITQEELAEWFKRKIEIEQAIGQASAMIDKVIKDGLLPIKKTNVADGAFTKLFRNDDNRELTFTVDEVIENFNKTKAFIELLKTDPSHIRIGTKCDGGCRAGSPAYHNKGEANKHLLTFCPDFDSDSEKTFIVLHESHHAAIDGSRDFAYQSTRLIDKLPHDKALLNAASFHLYAENIDNPANPTATIGPKVKDTNSIADPNQKKKTDLALALVNQWFRLVTFDMSKVSKQLLDAKNRGHYKSDENTYDIDEVYAKWFPITHPPRTPNEHDINIAKAIEEHTSTMEEAFSSPLNISESTTENKWKTGPGDDIQLNQPVLNLDINHLVVVLLQELVHATPNISAEREPLYVGTINDLRNLRNLDPQ